MKRPAPLRQGDTVAIVATARHISPEELSPTINLLTNWGLRVELPTGLYDSYCQLAGDDQHRANQLQEALDDENIKAIFCARGGYGTLRIIDRIDFSRFALRPKWIVGYSDLTVLHSHINALDAAETLHAIMPINIDAAEPLHPSAATETLRHQLFGLGEQRYTFANAGGDNVAGAATAPIVGGNLSTLYSLCGSASDITTDGKILFIEDLDEYLYHIDRMMRNLLRSGKLARLKGLVVGAFTDLHDNATPFGMTVNQIILECVESFCYPVCFNAPFGHIGKRNLALPLGREISLSVSPHNAQIIL